MNLGDPFTSRLALYVWIGCFAFVFGAGTFTVWALFRPEPRVVAILVGTWLLAVALFGGTMWQFNSHNMAQARLKREGIPGTARVIAVEGTDVLINRRPQVRMRLVLELPGRAPAEITRVEVLPFAGYGIAPGRVLHVYVDPADPENMLIDWAAPVAGGATADDAPVRGDAAERLAQLQRLRDAGQITEDEYRAQRQRILSDL
jgi:hypothetical protein